MIDNLLTFATNGTGLATGGLVSLGAIFFVAALIFIPRPPICILGGLMFGLAAFPVAVAGSTCGAAAAFLFARYLFRARFSAMTERRPRLKLIVDAVDAEGWRLLGLLRLASPIPGSASNYLFGLTQIGLWPFVAATLVGSAPQALAFVYLGAAGRMAIEPQTVSTVQAAFALAGCVLLLLAIYLVGRRIRSMVAVTLARRASAEPVASPSSIPSGALHAVSHPGRESVEMCPVRRSP